MAIQRIHGGSPRSFWLKSAVLITVYTKKEVYVVPEGMYVIVPEHGDWSDNDPPVKHRLEAGTTFQVVNGGSPHTLAVTDVVVSATPKVSIKAAALYAKDFKKLPSKAVTSSLELFDCLMTTQVALTAQGQTKYMEFSSTSIRYPDRGKESRRAIAVLGEVPLSISPEELEQLSVEIFERLHTQTSQPFTRLHLKNGQLV